MTRKQRGFEMIEKKYFGWQVSWLTLRRYQVDSQGYLSIVKITLFIQVLSW